MTTLTHPSSLEAAAAVAPIDGPVLFPGDDGWDGARQAWNLAVEQRPAAVVFPRSTGDVVAAVRMAEDAGATIVTQGTGHGAATHGPLDGRILVRTTNLRDLHIAGGTCRVGAGALWGEVAVAAGRYGLSGLAGSSTDVGVVGYTLGGGIGWLSRRYGLASNVVRRIEMVTADGHVRLVDDRHDPDLFWALRGGGGGLGIVTALGFDLFPVASVYAGTLAWDAIHAPVVLAAFREWTATLPEEATSIVRFLDLPPIPEVPEPFRGTRMMTLGAAVIGGAEHGARLVDPMRRIAPLAGDTFAMMPAADLRHLHGDPEGPTPGLAHHTLLAGLPDAALDALVGVAGVDTPAPLISVEVRHLGGALATATGTAKRLAAIKARIDPGGRFAMRSTVVQDRASR